MTTHGGIHFCELNTWHPDKAMTFYGQTLGWTFEAMPMGDGPDYHLARANGSVVAGIFAYTSPDFDGLPDVWLTYVAVDDVDARCAAAEAAGATINRAPFDVPGFGRIAVLDDPTGAVIAFIQPADMPHA